MGSKLSHLLPQSVNLILCQLIGDVLLVEHRVHKAVRLWLSLEINQQVELTLDARVRVWSKVKSMFNVHQSLGTVTTAIDVQLGTFREECRQEVGLLEWCCLDGLGGLGGRGHTISWD